MDSLSLCPCMSLPPLSSLTWTQICILPGSEGLRINPAQKHLSSIGSQPGDAQACFPTEVSFLRCTRSFRSGGRRRPAPLIYSLVGKEPNTLQDARPGLPGCPSSSLPPPPLHIPGLWPLPALTQAGSTPEGCKLGGWLWAWRGHCRRLGAPSCCPASGGSHT